MNPDEDAHTYAIRIHQRARQDIEETRQRLAAISDEHQASQWQDGMLAALSTLATYPHRCPLAREDQICKRSVRQLLYPQSPSGANTYRILFTIHESDEEAPFVFILHIRHGSRRPMTRREAREL